jgi:hypothetical protein
MDIANARELLQPFISFFTALFLSGVGVTIATQILKLKWIPVPATKYPRVTAAVASVVATLVSIYVSGLHFLLVGVWQYVAFILGVFIVSAVTYEHVVKGSPAAEGSGVAQ